MEEQGGSVHKVDFDAVDMSLDELIERDKKTHGSGGKAPQRHERGRGGRGQNDGGRGGTRGRFGRGQYQARNSVILIHQKMWDSKAARCCSNLCLPLSFGFLPQPLPLSPLQGNPVFNPMMMGPMGMGFNPAMMGMGMSPMMMQVRYIEISRLSHRALSPFPCDPFCL